LSQPCLQKQSFAWAVLAGWQLLGRDPGEDRQLVEREPAIPADRQLLGRGCSPGRLAAAWEEHV